MPPSDRQWADAYARQAASDLRVYRLLVSSANVEPSHLSHYLQMTSEKIAKAYLLRDSTASLGDVAATHAVLHRFLGNFATSPQSRQSMGWSTAQSRAVNREVRVLAREVECLAPAVDPESHPQNAEYPWASGDEVLCPCDYWYPTITLPSLGGTLSVFVSLVEAAIGSYQWSRPKR